VNDPAAPAADGRVARGERTRAAIVEAFLDLVSEGVVSPRARQIADRAGVSIRTIFQHFADLEALRTDVVTLQSERLRPYLAPLSGAGDLHGRITELVGERARLFEYITPVRRAMETSGISDTFDRGRSELDRRLRAQLEQQLAPELAALDRDGRATRLAAADALSSFACWDHLRRTQGRSVLQARRALTTALEALFP
jgi:AcrR family transcriptional regulator